MRKAIFISVILVLSNLTLIAQDSIRAHHTKTRVGLISGISFNKMEPIDAQQFKNFTFNTVQSYFGGVFIDQALEDDAVSLRLEASYMETSYSLSTYSPSDNYSNNRDILLNLKTLLIPALVRLNGFHSPAGLFVETGIVYSYSFENSWTVYDTRSYERIVELTLTQDDDLNASHLMGLCLGAGVSCKLYKRHWLYLNARIMRVVPREGKGEFRYYHPQVIAGVTL